jgi:hypothetical protein
MIAATLERLRPQRPEELTMGGGGRSRPSEQPGLIYPSLIYPDLIYPD